MSNLDQLLDFISNSISKAVIQTPMGSDGKFASKKVPTGSSVWITVTDSSSPLHGRHVLITKRPDGLFAITGGAGQSDEADARRHMVLTGDPKRTRKDEDLEEDAKKNVAYNEPLIEARNAAEREARKEIQSAAKDMLQALGIDEKDKGKLSRQREDIQEHIQSVLGEGREEDAERMAKVVMRQFSQADRKIGEQVQRARQLDVVRVGKRLQRFQGDDKTSLEETEPHRINLPNIEEIKDFEPEEQEAAIANYFDDEANKYFDEDRRDHVLPMDDDTPVVELGAHINPFNLEDEGKMQEATQSIQSYWDKRKQSDDLKNAMKRVKMTQAAPSTIANLIDESKLVGVSLTPDEIENKIEEEMDRHARDSSALAVYDVVSKFWNDDQSLVDQLVDKDTKDTVMKFHVDSGAATALAALAKQHLGLSIDSGRLITNGNVELASHAIAHQIRQNTKSADEYTKTLEAVKQHNIANQRETEVKALDRHGKLQSQYDEIQRQKASSELVDRVRIATLEGDNIVEQRKNIGAALGSLQASATFYDALDRLKGDDATDTVVINAGANIDDAENMISRLKLNKNRYTVDTSDLNSVKIHVGLSALGKHLTVEKDNQDKHDEYEKLKTNMDGVSEDDGGNLVVDNYEVPGFKDSFTDNEGEDRQYKWRAEQRNDIEWLRKATEKTADNPSGQGGGLITRVVGAGKTNTALGFMAHNLADNPDYKGLVVVPKGRSQQWHEEATKFTDLNVELIPDGSKKEDVDRILANSQPGTVYMMGHREASRSSDTLEAMQTNHDLGMKFHGLVVDEPQELQTKTGSGNIGAMGQRLMKLPVNHRIGLTATPARKSPLEAYDMLKWTQGGAKDLGSKAAFKRTFSGFGSGTNAQDAAINKLYFDKIKPYVSGDRITHPTFKTKYNNVEIQRTPAQIQKQRTIEQGADEHVNRRRSELVEAAQNNPNHPLRRVKDWERTVGKRAAVVARKELETQHQENMDGGDFRDNAKLLSLGESIKNSGDDKHVVFVDSATQRRAVNEMLLASGMPRSQVKNMASSTGSISGKDMGARARAFQKDPNVKVIMIDKTSSSGYNLQQGDQMHIVGAPDDASTYLQAQGRIARMPREGDIDINTYKYSDNPVEQAKWNDLDSQLKILRAAAPGMFPD